MINEELKLINDALDTAREHGLEAEVVWSALNAYRDRATCDVSMDSVLEEALSEWDI